MQVARVLSLPKCDFCEKAAAYDAKTTFGPWAYMCEEHYARNAVKGLGTGRGQKLLVVKEEGK